jgi:hypothetical protein
VNGKEVMDHAANILRRQDLDRNLLLLFINTARRAILRDKPVRRFLSYRQDLPVVSGLIDAGASRIKSAHVVEWFRDNGDGTTVKVYLAKLFSYRQAMELFGSLMSIGEPQAFLEMGTDIRILPAPIPGSGQINVYGEFWPEDLSDSPVSSDVTTVEMPEALIYLGAAEYFDLLGEAQKGQYWRQKGLAIVESYLAQMQKMEFEHYDVWKRRPFGKGSRKTRAVNYSGFTLEDLDMGEWT